MVSEGCSENIRQPRGNERVYANSDMLTQHSPRYGVVK